MNYKLDKEFITPNKYSRPQVKIDNVLGVVWHWYANPNSSAMANRNYFENRKYGKTSYGSSHYLIGLKGEAIQAIPEYEMAYHVGSHVYTKRALNELGSYPNATTIGIECAHVDWDGKMTDETYNSLIELTSDIVRRHNLTADDIWLHYETNGWKDCHRWFVNNQDEYKKAKESVAKKLGQKTVKEPQKISLDDVKLVESDKEGMYEVKRGDTLWGISQAFNTTVDKLEKLNPKVNATNLKIGSKIRVEEVKQAPKKKEVKKGDMDTDSIVTYLNSVGEKSDFNSREKLAKEYGINDYSGTAKQNIKLLEMLRSGNKPKEESKPKVKPKVKGDMDTNSIVTYLNSIGEDSNFSNRSKLSKKYGVSNYKGTASQNTQLLKIIRDGDSPNVYGVANGNVWLHSKPEYTSHTRTEVLRKGEKVEIYSGVTSNMYKTSRGYVSKKYITV